MRRINTVLTIVLLGLTFPLGHLVYKDVLRLRAEAVRAQAYAPPKGFGGLTLEGKSYALEDGHQTTFVGLFVLHRDRLEQDVALWNALQQALSPNGVELVGTCDHADCASHVRSAQIAPRFTVLSAVGFQQARSLAQLDARHGWLLAEKSGRLRGVFDVPREARGVAGLALTVSRALKEDPHASPRPSS